MQVRACLAVPRVPLLLLLLSALLLTGCQPTVTAAGRGSAAVMLVCNGSTSACPRGHHYRTVQSAVNAARPGDWILIWPGVYHENNLAHHAGVWVDTPDVHIRGFSRDSVIIDGSSGSSTAPCPSSPGLQNFTPRDGIVVWRASGVSIQNLTVCDYLAGPGGEHGTQVWWTGAKATDGGEAESEDGDGSGELGLGSFTGSYLTATSMYSPADVHSKHLAEFGIFAGNARGPGIISNSYASNMANGAYYVGACQRECNTLLTGDRGTNSAIGFLGTNSGGRLVVRNSEFDENRTGIVLTSLNTDDLPPSQDGRCPGSLATSCTIIERNRIIDNNNAGAPAFAVNPAIGTGIEISGGQFDTVRNNVIEGNGSWGLVAHDNLDLLSEMPGSHCQGGTPNVAGEGTCLFIAQGSVVSANVFGHDGTFRNPTNGDLAASGLARTPAPTPRNCFFANRDLGGPLTSSPAEIEVAHADGRPCGQPGTGSNSLLLQQVRCADGNRCPAGRGRYPQPTEIVSARLPRLPTMPHPCAGVPENAYCR